jgi:carbon storage regulator
MLVLARKTGESVLVEGGIRIVVLACDGRGVRLGIEAPRDGAIVREEIAPPTHPARPAGLRAGG